MKRKADAIDGEAPLASNGNGNGNAGSNSAKRRKCPYLDTINHQLLDFDFEKVCSISLSDQNVYACLVCGKYFKGRGKTTHAFTHSVQSSHHVFINLQNDKIYCLPDNYEVVDNTLKPIQDALRPSFEAAGIARLDENRILAQDAFGVSYLPGFIGLNNLKNTDYINVVVQALAHVPPLRDFFLANQMGKTKSLLVLRFGELLRKMWSPHNFKNTISPHELVQEISVSSKKRFHVGKQNESVELLAWLLNELHRKYDGSHVTHVLQGSHRLKKTYRIDSLPAYLIFHVKRFTRNNFFIEKNPTIVNFPVKNLELRDYLKLDQSLPSEEDLGNM
ncbi:hypothetical protein BBJ28_00008983 [Nothophytophthora sp. Chile5]|nr:hypothetical protein BBJ28_00008983 [Nothophytophthora sp. Chile5]